MSAADSASAMVASSFIARTLKPWRWRRSSMIETWRHSLSHLIRSNFQHKYWIPKIQLAAANLSKLVRG